MITGTTRLYAVIGDPVAQVRAPELLNALFAAEGIDAVLVPVHVGPAALATVLPGLQAIENLRGILVTVPHKISVLAFADTVNPAAGAAGSANALRRESDGTWTADNFDGAGFVRGLRAAGHEIAHARVAVVGAGGAGAAIAAAVLAGGAAHVGVTDLDLARAAGLAAHLGARWPGRAAAGVDLARVDLAVNATPLGLRADDPLPFDPQCLPAQAVVADIIMRPKQTLLLRTAATAGYRTHYGHHMLDTQIDLYREFFALAGQGPVVNTRVTG